MSGTDLPIIALDRDGTLIEEADYLTDPRDIRFLPGAIAGLKRLKKAGFQVVVLTNQSGLARGFITMDQLRRVNQRFTHLLKRNKVSLDGYYWCPHAPGDRCSCRKPKLGMLKQAAKHLKRSWHEAISVGDRPSDVGVGQRAGGSGILVLTGYGRRWAKAKESVKPDYIAPTFLKAVEWILKKRKDRG
jgi:D-glycero-D-manno-heptose 1,7-bisphosphate phosphatase